MPRALLAVTAVVLSLAVLPAAAHAYTFSSPSGNIGCFIDRSFVRCDIRNKDWDAPKPKGCKFDYGQGLSVTRRGSKGRVVCAGDTTTNDQHPLRYGRTIRRGSLRCTSRESGMECKNGRGHGFFIAKQRYRLF